MKLNIAMAKEVTAPGSRRVLARYTKRAFYHVVEPRPGWGGGMVALCGRLDGGAAWADYTGGEATVCGRCWELAQQGQLEMGRG